MLVSGVADGVPHGTPRNVHDWMMMNRTLDDTVPHIYIYMYIHHPFKNYLCAPFTVIYCTVLIPYFESSSFPIFQHRAMCEWIRWMVLVSHGITYPPVLMGMEHPKFTL